MVMHNTILATIIIQYHIGRAVYIEISYLSIGGVVRRIMLPETQNINAKVGINHFKLIWGVFIALFSEIIIIDPNYSVCISIIYATKSS